MAKRVKAGAYLAVVLCGAALFCAVTGCTGPLVYRPEKKVVPVTVAQGASMTKNNLPPQPDPKANNATLAGIDSTGVGVRDDVHLWIYASYTSTRKRTVLMGMARILQGMMVKPPKTSEEAEKIERSYDAAVLLLKGVPGLNPGESKDMDSNLNMRVVDTPGRLRAYLQYDQLLRGDSPAPSPPVPVTGGVKASPSLLPQEGKTTR